MYYFFTHITAKIVLLFTTYIAILTIPTNIYFSCRIHFFRNDSKESSYFKIVIIIDFWTQRTFADLHCFFQNRFYFLYHTKPVAQKLQYFYL